LVAELSFSKKWESRQTDRKVMLEILMASAQICFLTCLTSKVLKFYANEMENSSNINQTK